jgi:hypothetical protein
MAYWIRDEQKRQGHGEGSRLVFLDNIPGPATLLYAPGEKEPKIDDLLILKKAWPHVDWATVVAEQAEQIRKSIISEEPSELREGAVRSICSESS